MKGEDDIQLQTDKKTTHNYLTIHHFVEQGTLLDHLFNILL